MEGERDRVGICIQNVFVKKRNVRMVRSLCLHGAVSLHSSSYGAVLLTIHFRIFIFFFSIFTHFCFSDIALRCSSLALDRSRQSALCGERFASSDGFWSRSRFLRPSAGLTSIRRIEVRPADPAQLQNRMFSCAILA